MWAELQHSLPCLPSRAGAWGTPWAWQQQQEHPASATPGLLTGQTPRTLTGHWQDTDRTLLVSWGDGEVQVSEQTGWQCHAASSAVLSLASPSALAVSSRERLSTQSCCSQSRAPRLKPHLCLPMARQ